MVEKASEYNPKAGYLRRFLSMLYAQVGRSDDARAMFEVGFGNWPAPMKKVQFYMTLLPFKSHQVAESIAEGYVTAGMAGEPSSFYKLAAENILAEQELRSLFSGKKVTGFHIVSKKQWWIERSKDGKATIQDGDTADTGKSWIEDDMLCNQWDNLYERLTDCWVVYRNPEGTPENFDEFLGAPGYGVYPFSPVE